MVTGHVSYMTVTWWSLPTEQSVANFFCKGLGNKYLVLCGLHMVSVPTYGLCQFCHCNMEVTTDSTNWLSYHFNMSWNILLLIFFPSLGHVLIKAILNLQTVHKQATRQVWPMHHSLLTPGLVGKKTKTKLLQYNMSQCWEGRYLFCLAVRRGRLRTAPERRKHRSWAFQSE